MKKIMKKNKGITLIALVITIIVLIILAGVVINLTLGENGILKKAIAAKEKTTKEEAVEKVNLMLASWKIENATNEISLDDYLFGGKYNKEIQGYDIQIPIAKEDNNYIATVNIGNIKYDVTIEDKNGEAEIISVAESGKRISVSITENNYAFEGSNMEATVIVTAPNGDTIENIESASDNLIVGAIENLGTKEVKTTFTITIAGTKEYKYKIVTANNKEQEFTNKVNNMLDNPSINVANITSSSFKINVTNDYPEDANIQYEYYINNELKSSKSANKSYVFTGLKSKTEYDVKVLIYCGEKSMEVKEKITTKEIIIRTGFYNGKDLLSNYEQYKDLFDDDINTSINLEGYSGVYDLKFKESYNVNSIIMRTRGLTNNSELRATVYGYTDENYSAKISIGKVDFKTTTSPFTFEIPINGGNYFGLYILVEEPGSWVNISDVYIYN